MATMRDVAEAAGVSVSTVSHVVNGTRLVNTATRERVERAIAETGWRHNALARSLARGKGTGWVGFAVTGLADESVIGLHRSIERRLAETGLALLMTGTHDDPIREHTALTTLISRQVDGIIMVLGEEPDERVLDLLQHSELPVVLADRAADLARDFVGSENIAPTADLTEHLIGHGHRRVAMISAPAGFTTSAERIRGYQLGLERTGLPFLPELLVPGGSSWSAGAAAIDRLLALPEPPTAVVCGNNQMAIGLLRRVRDHGVRVPQDLAVGCFDDFDWADLLTPPLTAIAQPWTEMGTTAAELIMRRIEDPGAEVRRVRLLPELNIRGSCGCPAAAADRAPVGLPVQVPALP